MSKLEVRLEVNLEVKLEVKLEVDIISLTYLGNVYQRFFFWADVD